MKLLLHEDEYTSWYRGYLDRLESPHLDAEFQRSHDQLLDLLKKWGGQGYGLDYRYAPGKWSIAQVLQHLIDAEVVFLHRAMWFARREASELPGYDHNQWVEEVTIPGQMTWEDWTTILSDIRRTTRHQFRLLSEEQLLRKGRANDASFSVRALGYIISGHMLHHTEVLKDKYTH